MVVAASSIKCNAVCTDVSVDFGIVTDLYSKKIAKRLECIEWSYSVAQALSAAAENTHTLMLADARATSRGGGSFAD